MSFAEFSLYTERVFRGAGHATYGQRLRGGRLWIAPSPGHPLSQPIWPRPTSSSPQSRILVRNQFRYKKSSRFLAGQSRVRCCSSLESFVRVLRRVCEPQSVFWNSERFSQFREPRGCPGSPTHLYTSSPLTALHDRIAPPLVHTDTPPRRIIPVHISRSSLHPQQL